jgi:glycosyltransferase involved in cell wall biosynthesis
MNRVLMIAFHYPPCAESSGVHRTLKFSRYLPENGWQPIVLTVHPRVYDRTSVEQLGEIPSMVEVQRVFALDVGRHLAPFRRYPRWAALPDRYVTWWLGAVPTGLSLIRRLRPRVIWSTFPVATAHLIGLTLHRRTGIPWVADFRDSMTEDSYPPDPLRRRAHKWIERRVVANASRLVFTAPSAIAMYRTRYPHLGSERCVGIANGYDERDFETLVPPSSVWASGRPLRLVHSGLIYPEERDPRPFFRAVSRLKRGGLLTAQVVHIHLRGSGSQAYYARLLRELDIDDVIQLVGPVPYREALQECLDADALLLLQGASCNHQIPAKVYEYLRARRPILALTSERGDTAALIRATGGATIVDLADENAIAEALPEFLGTLRNGSHPLPEMAVIRSHARDQQTRDLARVLLEVAGRPAPEPGTRVTSGEEGYPRFEEACWSSSRVTGSFRGDIDHVRHQSSRRGRIGD